MENLRVATFDCYGTLIDWEGGLGSFLYQLARRHGDEDPGPGQALAARWEDLQFGLVQAGYRPYREILGESLRQWCGERGYRWDARDGNALVQAMESWQPFPDTVPALRCAQAAGLRLVIVSNTDRSIMAHTLRQLELDFDGVVVAEDCRAYKPALPMFERAVHEVGEHPERILHVGFGFRYDIPPAQRLGLRTAWVNRHAEPPPGNERPHHTWRDLWGLADLVTSG